MEQLKDGLTLGAMKKIDKVLATAQAKVRKIAYEDLMEQAIHQGILVLSKEPELELNWE